MNKKLAKVIMMGLLCASVLPSVGEAASIAILDSEVKANNFNDVYTSGIFVINGVTKSIVSDSLYVSADTDNNVAIDNSGVLVINRSTDNTDLDEEVQYIKGNIVHNNGAETNINLKGYSSNEPYSFMSIFRGGVVGSDEKFSLTVGKNALWAIYNQSNTIVNGITLDGGTIDLTRENAWLSNATGHAVKDWDNNFQNVTFKDFKITSQGEYDFLVSTDLHANKGDCINFIGDTPDKTIGVYIKNKDGKYAAVSDSEGHSVTIVTAPENSKMEVQSYLGFYDDGGFEVAPIVNKEVDDAEDLLKWNFVGWTHTGEKLGVNDEAEAETINHKILVEDLDPIFKRFNDLRTDPSEVGVWVRGEAGETKIRNLGYDQNIISGGYDWEYKNNAGILFTGIGFTYSTNECDDKAVGDTKGYGFNAYGSWYGKDNNDYVDLIVKYGKLDKEYAGYDELGYFVSGDYDKDLFTIAAKYGRRIFKDDWYYEPSVGFTWGRVGSANFIDNLGTHIHADSSYSTIASLGVQVGKNIKGIEYYGKAELMHDFDGKIHVSAPGINDAYDDMGGTWLKCAIGASRKIDENNSFYLEVERDFGNKVEKPYGLSLGYRFTW